MALIKCPKCGHAVADIASKCPNCGYPIAAPKFTRMHTEPDPKPSDRQTQQDPYAEQEQEQRQEQQQSKGYASSYQEKSAGTSRRKAKAPRRKRNVGRTGRSCRLAGRSNHRRGSFRQQQAGRKNNKEEGYCIRHQKGSEQKHGQRFLKRGIKQ